MVVLGRNRKHAAKIVSLVVLFVFGISSVLQIGRVGDKEDQQQQFAGRHLLQLVEDNDTFEENCSRRNIDQFPDDPFTPEQREQGAVAFHIFLSLYLVCAIAVVCDDYFVASMESICDVLNLQADVAGATFMAAGSSAPEFFTAVIGLFLTNSEPGLSTVVGAAVCNLLFVIGLCGLGSGMIIYLTWWPILRDCLVYILSIIVLVAVTYDEQVHWYEALIMVLCYIAYVVFMYFNRPVGDYLVHKVNVWKDRDSMRKEASQRRGEQRAKDIADERSRLIPRRVSERRDSVGSDRGLSESARSDQSVQQQLAHGGLRRERRSSLRRSRSDSISQAMNIDYKISAADYQAHDYESPLTWPETITGRIWYVVMLPVTLLFMLTIPDCRRPGVWKRMFSVTFAMSVLWIGGLSYVLVWMVVVAGDTIGIPDAAMSVTFVAIATSVPDALSSLYVARDGYGDMAVANAIGSNVCSILLCLGLPWLLKTGAVDVNTVLAVPSASITFVSVTLVVVVLFLLCSMLANSWKLNKKYGALCLVAYVLVVIFGCLYQLNVFSDVILPPC